MNKIGKNPNLVANKDSDDADSEAVNAYVSAIATKESVDSFEMSAPRYTFPPFRGLYLGTFKETFCFWYKIRILACT